MSPELTGFALGLLLGAAKVLAIASAGFAVAWWRARARIRVLEAEQLEADRLTSENDDLREIRAGLSRALVHLEQLDRSQALLIKQWSGQPPAQSGALPSGHSARRDT